MQMLYWFIRWILLWILNWDWYSIGIGLYFALLGLFIFLLVPKVRKYSKDKIKNYRQIFFLIILALQILIFITPLTLSTYFIGISFVYDQMLSLIILGLSVNVFWIVQLPLITKANIEIDFSTDGLKSCKKNISLKKQCCHIVHTRIYNLGFTTLKNSMIAIYFGKGIKIIPYDEKIYKNIDFVKKFSVQKCNNGVLFTPKDNWQTIPPQEWFLFPLILETSNDVLELEAKVLFSSEKSWGQKEKISKVFVK